MVVSRLASTAKGCGPPAQSSTTKSPLSPWHRMYAHVRPRSLSSLLSLSLTIIAGMQTPFGICARKTPLLLYVVPLVFFFPYFRAQFDESTT